MTRWILAASIALNAVLVISNLTRERLYDQLKTNTSDLVTQSTRLMQQAMRCAEQVNQMQELVEKREIIMCSKERMKEISKKWRQQ